MSQAVANAALATAVWPMRDRLDKLEKIGVLDVEPWLAWRDVRNRLAHEYPGTADLRHAAVLAAVESAGAMLQAWVHWKARLPRTAMADPVTRLAAEMPPGPGTATSD